MASLNGLNGIADEVQKLEAVWRERTGLDNRPPIIVSQSLAAEIKRAGA